MLGVLLVVGAAHIGQPASIAGIMGPLKALESRTARRIHRVGEEMAQLKSSTVANNAVALSSFLETDSAYGLGAQLDALQGRAQASLQRLENTLTALPLQKQVQAAEAETGEKIDLLLSKAKAALPTAWIETEPTSDAALDAFAKKLQALEDTTKAAIAKAGWKPTSFLEEQLKTLDAHAAKEKARALERAADKAKLEGIFGATLATLKKESEDGAKQLVSMHERALATGRATPGDWNPFDPADASSLLETGEVKTPMFAEITARLRQLEAQTKKSLHYFASSFIQAGQGSQVQQQACTKVLTKLEQSVHKVWQRTNETVQHFDDEYEPHSPEYKQMHEEFASMESQFEGLKSQIDASSSDLASATRRLKAETAPTSLLQLDLQASFTASFENLRDALMVVQRLLLAKAVDAKKYAKNIPVPDAYNILGLPRDATGKQLKERYDTLRATLKINPTELALVKRAYSIVKHASTHAYAAMHAKMRTQQQEHQRQFQVEEAQAVLGVGDEVEHEVKARYQELRKLEAQEDALHHGVPRKTAVQRAYETLARHRNFSPIMKKAPAHRHRISHYIPVEEAKRILGVNEATPALEIRQRFLALQEVLLRRAAPTAIKLHAMHELEDAYMTVKMHHVGEGRAAPTRKLVEVLPEGQLRTH
jgi:hypothetical protein